MNAKELVELVNKDALYPIKRMPDVTIGVKILDARLSYGRTQVLITPHAGHGEFWADLSSLRGV